MELGPVTRSAAGAGQLSDIQVQWEPAPLALLRRTGFPVRLVERLADPSVGEALALHRDTESLARETRTEFLTSGFPRIVAERESASSSRADFKHLYRIRRALERGTEPPQESRTSVAAFSAEAAGWMARLDTAAAKVTHSAERLDAVAERALEQARAQLWRTADDDRFREAVLLSNPGAWERVLRQAVGTPPTRRNAKVRRAEWLLYAYLQRFCVKNESVSFFGPVDPVRIDPGGPSLVLNRCPGTLRARWLRAAHWAVQALADRIATDPAIRDSLPLRPAPGCALSRDQRYVILATGRRVALPPAAAAAVAFAADEPTLAELADRVGPEQTRTAEKLLERGLLRRDLAVPTTVDDPLDWLRRTVASLPPPSTARDRWLANLDAFASSLEACRADPAGLPSALQSAEQRFTELSGLPARRAAGAVYADRLILTEDCRGDVVDSAIGGQLLEQLSQSLEPVVQLCASYSLTVSAAVARRAGRLHAELAAQGQVGLLAFMSALDSRVSMEEVAADPAVAAFTKRLTALVRARTRDQAADLAPEELAGLLRPLPPGLSVSPDVFLVAADEAGLRDQPGLVVGEIHHGTQVWTHLTALAAGQPPLAEELAALLSVEGRSPAALVHRRTQGKAFERDLPGPDIEVLGRSQKETGQRIRAADVEVVADPDGTLRLTHPEHPDLFLRARDPRAVSSWLFGPPPVVLPPLDLAAGTPRVRIGDVVVWRRSRRIPAAEFAELLAAESAAALLLAADRLRSAHRLSARGFVRVPGERKPVWADLTEPLGLEHLAHLIRSAEPGPIQHTELLPDTDQWWLQDRQGRYSSELRMTYCTTARPRKPLAHLATPRRKAEQCPTATM